MDGWKIFPTGLETCKNLGEASGGGGFLAAREPEIWSSLRFSDGLGCHLKSRTITGNDLELPTQGSIAHLRVLLLAEEGQWGYLLVN